MLQRAISYVCEWQLFLSLYFSSSIHYYYEKNRDRKSGNQEKIQLQLRIRMVKGAREKLCVNVECTIACDVYIMAFYSAGKIDSMIEQFSFFPSIQHTFDAFSVCVCVCECELENLILNDCCKIFIDPEFFRLQQLCRIVQWTLSVRTLEHFFFSIVSLCAFPN